MGRLTWAIVVDEIDKIVANEGYQIQLVGNTKMKMLLDFQSVVDAIMDVIGGYLW